MRARLGRNLDRTGVVGDSAQDRAARIGMAAEIAALEDRAATTAERIRLERESLDRLIAWAEEDRIAADRAAVRATWDA